MTHLTKEQTVASINPKKVSGFTYLFFYYLLQPFGLSGI
jgi:hypothetical protein